MAAKSEKQNNNKKDDHVHQEKNIPKNNRPHRRQHPPPNFKFAHELLYLKKQKAVCIQWVLFNTKSQCTR